MKSRPPQSPGRGGAQAGAGAAGADRAERLKAALKANIARRKAQARQRAEAGREDAEGRSGGPAANKV